MTTKTTLAELFCQNCQSQYTAVNAKYRLRAFARWLEAEHHVNDLEAVTVQHILSYKAHLAQSGLAPASQARALETLRSFFRWCHSEGMINHDPARNVKSPRAVLNREPEYLTTEESRKLFDSIDPKGKHAARDRAMLWVLAVGLRVGEVVTLSMADVIPPKGDKLGGLRVNGKRSYQRIVPLSQVAYDSIAEYMNTHKDAPNDAPLFVCRYAGQSERRLTTRAVQKWFADLVTSAGLDRAKAHCHAGRHGFAMRMIYESTTPGGIYTVSKLLGHSSIQTTQKYLHVGPMGRAAMESAVLSDPLAA